MVNTKAQKSLKFVTFLSRPYFEQNSEQAVEISERLTPGETCLRLMPPSDLIALAELHRGLGRQETLRASRDLLRSRIGGALRPDQCAWDRVTADLRRIGHEFGLTVSGEVVS